MAPFSDGAAELEDEHHALILFCCSTGRGEAAGGSRQTWGAVDGPMVQGGNGHSTVVAALNVFVFRII